MVLLLHLFMTKPCFIQSAGSSTCKVPSYQQIFAEGRKGLLSQQYLHACTAANRRKQPEIRLQPRLVDEIVRRLHGTITGSNVSFHGSP